MNRNVVLALAALVLIAAGVALYMMMGREPEPGTATQPAGSDRVMGTPTVTTTGEPRDVPSPSLGSAPALEAGSGNPRDYAVGDYHVRDHRAGDHAPLDTPPNVHEPGGRALPSELVHAITQQLRQQMMKCAADLPHDARGPAPRLEGQILVGIKSGTLSITKSTPVLRDISGPAADAFAGCVEKRATGLTADAGTETDLTDYSINLSFAIP